MKIFTETNVIIVGSLLACCLSVFAELQLDLPVIDEPEKAEVVEDSLEKPEELPLRLTLELVDGSRIIGVPSFTSFPVVTSYGKMDIPLKIVSSIKMDDDKETFLFSFQNGDIVKGVINSGPVKLDTIVGKLSVRLQLISVIHINTGGFPGRGLVLHYSFDKDEGGKVSNQGDNGLDGTVYGAKWTDKGKKGGCLTFDGVNDYIQLKESAALDLTAEFTLAGWMKTPSLKNTAIIAKRSTREGYPYVLTHHADGVMRLYSSGSQYLWVETGNKVTAGQWCHFVITRKKSKINIYMNGHPDIKNVQVMAEGPSRKDAFFCIGAQNVDGRVSSPYKGQLDEIMIFNRELSAAEIKRIYNSQK